MANAQRRAVKPAVPKAIASLLETPAGALTKNLLLTFAY